MADMKPYRVDLERSCQLYNQNKALIKKNESFQSVFNVTTAIHLPPSWKIAYGYVRRPASKMLIQHCFILDTAENKVIDFTLCSSKRVYYVVAAMSFQKYIHRVDKTQHVDLYNYAPLQKAFAAFEECAARNRFLCLH